MFPSFLLIGSGGSALLSSFQYLYGLENIFMSLSEYPDFWTPPVSIVTEENHEASQRRPNFVTPDA